MSRLRFSDDSDQGEYRRGHPDTGASDHGGYIGGAEYRRGHRGAEARYRYNGYQESSYQAASGSMSSNSWRSSSGESPRYSGGRSRSWRDESPRHEIFSSHRDKSQYDRYAQNPYRDLSGQRQRTSSGSSYSRDYPDMTSGGGARELQSILRSSGSSGHYHQDSRSSYSSSFNTMTAGSRSMSHSYLDVQDLNSEAEEMLRGHGGQVMDRGRLRHQSLTYGVCEADLERAARTVMTSEPAEPPFSLAMPVREGRGKIQTRHSLPDLFEGLDNHQKASFLGRNSQDLSQSKVQQQQHQAKSSSSRGFPSPIVIPPTPPASSLTPASVPVTSYQEPLASEEVSKEDETLKMLQRHYLQAILTLAPPHKLSEASTTIKSQAQAHALAAKEESFTNPTPSSVNTSQDGGATAGPDEASLPASISSVNPPPKILDSILKLWEESQAENSRLRQDMTSMRQELEATKQQLEAAFQANTSVSDADKEERKALERKFEEMEEQLKDLTANNNSISTESDMTMAKLKEDNNRLREENAGLIKVMARLSDNKK